MLKTPREVAEESDVIISGKQILCILKNEGNLSFRKDCRSLPTWRKCSMGLMGCWLGCLRGRFGLIIPQLTTNKTRSSQRSSRQKVRLPSPALPALRSVCLQRVSSWSVPLPEAWRLSRKARWPCGWEAVKRLIRRWSRSWVPATAPWCTQVGWDPPWFLRFSPTCCVVFKSAPWLRLWW